MLLLPFGLVDLSLCSVSSLWGYNDWLVLGLAVTTKLLGTILLISLLLKLLFSNNSLVFLLIVPIIVRPDLGWDPIHIDFWHVLYGIQRELLLVLFLLFHLELLPCVEISGHAIFEHLVHPLAPNLFHFVLFLIGVALQALHPMIRRIILILVLLLLHLLLDIVKCMVHLLLLLEFSGPFILFLFLGSALLLLIDLLADVTTPRGIIGGFATPIIVWALIASMCQEHTFAPLRSNVGWGLVFVGDLDLRVLS